MISGTEWLLGALKGADFNAAGTDQQIGMRPGKYIIRRIVVTNASATILLAAGGIYTAASKGGTAVVGALQVYSTLLSSTVSLDLTLASGAINSALTAGILNLNLTTANGSAVTADVYVFGDWLP